MIALMKAPTTTSPGVTIRPALTAYAFSLSWMEDRLPPGFCLLPLSASIEEAAQYLRKRFPDRKCKNRLTLEACLIEIRKYVK